MNVTGNEDIGHREAWELIPWLVNGSARTEDRARVEHHLAGCAACREEFAFQRQLRATMARESSVAVGDPQVGLEQLLARIETEQVYKRVPAVQRRPRRSLQWMLLAAVMIEGVGIAALSGTLWLQDSAQARYRTLSTPETPAPGTAIRVVLTENLSVAGLQDLLDRTRLQIVAGPSAAGVYSLAPRVGENTFRTDIALAQLRSNPGVRFAEPIGNRSGAR